jgi:hypothetical protein
MSSWFNNSKNSTTCNKSTEQVSVVTRNFAYEKSATIDFTTIPMRDLLGADQLVIDEVSDAGVILPNTPVYMPSHVDLLGMFKKPKVHDTFSIVFANNTGNSIVLTIENPIRTAIVLQGQVTEIFFRIINPTSIDGVADVKIMGVNIGATSSILVPIQQQRLALGNAADIMAGQALISPQDLWTDRPTQIVINNDSTLGVNDTASAGTAPKTRWSQSLSTAAGWESGPHNLLLAPGATEVGMPVVGPLFDGLSIGRKVIVTNNGPSELVIQLGMQDSDTVAPGPQANVTVKFGSSIPLDQQNQNTAVYGASNVVLPAGQTISLNYGMMIAGTAANNWFGSTIEFKVFQILVQDDALTATNFLATTTDGFRCASNVPRVQLVSTSPGVPVDRRAKQMTVDDSGKWQFSHLNDSETLESSWLVAATDGTQSTSITHSATTHSFVPDGAGQCTLNVNGDVTAANIAGGTYLPICVNGDYITNTNPYLAYFSRVGSTVTVGGKVDVVKEAGALSKFTISLPVPSTFTGSEQLSGIIGNADNYRGGLIVAVVGGTAEVLIYEPTSAVIDTGLWYSFIYQIV